MIEAHCRHALLVLQELKDANINVDKDSKPTLIWAVQNFNFFNLKNSHISETELLSMLQATSEATFADKKQAQVIFGGSSGPNQQMLNMLFKDIRLVPVRRPSMDDEVVANLKDHDSQELSEDYLSDLKRVKNFAFNELVPISDGPKMASAIEQWALHGHIVLQTSDGSSEQVNETYVLESFHRRMGAYFTTNCNAIKQYVNT
jgi:hypothetical protein